MAISSHNLSVCRLRNRTIKFDLILSKYNDLSVYSEILKSEVLKKAALAGLQVIHPLWILMDMHEITYGRMILSIRCKYIF